MEDEDRRENQYDVAQQDNDNCIGDVPSVRSEPNTEELPGESDRGQYRQQNAL
jgi:hypothetical protein